MLQRRDQVPHFAATRLDGSHAAYSEIWQRKNLLLVVLPVEESPERAAYVARLEDSAQHFAAHEADCVITTDTVSDVPHPGVLIADRWGEIQFIAAAQTVADLPTIDEIFDWLRFIEHQCPECEGESR